MDAAGVLNLGVCRPQPVRVRREPSEPRRAKPSATSLKYLRVLMFQTPNLPFSSGQISEPLWTAADATRSSDSGSVGYSLWSATRPTSFATCAYIVGSSTGSREFASLASVPDANFHLDSSGRFTPRRLFRTPTPRRFLELRIRGAVTL